MMHFYVKTIRCASGERLPALIDRASGLPHFDATLWVVSALRSSNVASATIEQALRSIAILLSVLRARGIDLASRLSESRFLEAVDASDVIGYFSRPRDSIQFESSRMAASRASWFSLILDQGIDGFPSLTRTKQLYDHRSDGIGLNRWNGFGGQPLFRRRTQMEISD